MLDNKIHNHLDELDAIQELIRQDFELLYSQLDIEELINDPHTTLNDFVDIIKNTMIEKYIPDAVEQGFALSKEIKKLDVKVDPSLDGNKNEVASSDTSIS